MVLKPIILLPICVTLLFASCSPQISSEELSTSTLLIVTSTLPPTLTPQPSETPPPPPLRSQPTVAPVEGTTSTQVNVRAEPSTASQVLGIIPINTKVEVVGKDPGEHWWQINYPQGIDGKGWVTAQYITTATEPEVPVIGGDRIDPKNGNVAIVQQQLNVRSGPGTDFNSLGTLNAQDVVNITGKDPNGVWLQIDFSSGPEGKGWISAAFVQAKGVENLPIITEAGVIIGTGTPTIIPFTPTATLVPAWADNDSANNPIANVIFEQTGTRTLIYNGDVSAPEGDSQDWIAFKAYSKFIYVSLECIGSNSLKVEMTENTLPVSVQLACSSPMKEIAVNASSNYSIHLQLTASAGALQYTNYILTIKTSP